MRWQVFRLVLLVLLCPVGAAYAGDRYFALKYDEVRMRNGPSFASGVYYTYQRHFLPVKEIDRDGNWLLVVDWQDYQGWINLSQLTAEPSLVVTVEDIILYRRADLKSRKLARLTESVVLRPLTCDGAWCEVVVVQDEGYRGFVPRQGLWGSFPAAAD